MDRIRPLSRDEAPEDVRRYFDADMERYGMVLNPTQVYAHSPEVMRAARGLSAGIAKAGRIPAALRALLCVRVATQVGCPFWVDINAAGGSDAGLSFDKIDALPDYQTSDLYTPAEKAALELADVVSQAKVDVPDDLYARLSGFYDEAEMVELAATIAMENYRSRFNRVFAIEAQGLYCPVPQATDYPHSGG